MLMWRASVADAQSRPGTEHQRVPELQRLVDSLRDRMGISASVTVAVVEHDAHRVSVRRSPDTAVAFALSAERGLVEALTTEQIEAALAHELGHVWIYTHHPYLQTEQLANRVAMRVVPRERLVEVYRALWGGEEMPGSLEAFLGIEGGR
jgi:Zn-dependent protease with chaperone function